MSADAEDLSKLLSSAALVFVGSVISSTSTLVERVIVGRLLSPEAYGEFSIALAIFTLGSTLGAAGFTQGVPRFMARFEDIRDVRGAWVTGLGISIVLSILVALALLASSPVLVPRLFETDEAMPVYSVFVLAIPLFVSFRIGVGAIRGEENTRYKILSQDLGYPLVRVGLVTSLLLLGFGLVGTGIGYLVAVFSVTLLTFALLNRLTPLRGAFRLHSREMVSFSAPLIVSTIMAVLLTRTDTLMLGYFRASSEVGVYNAAYPLAGILTVVLSAFGYMYLPVASRLDSDGEGSVERVYEITTKWIYIVVFPAFVTLLVFPDEIVTIVFGAEYAAGGAALAILAVGFFTNAAVGRNRETLSALGATKFILASNVIAFVVNFFLNLLLIPIYGFIGAAVASAGSFIVLNVAVYAFLRAKFDITPFNRVSTKAFVLLPLVVVPFGFLLRQVLPGSLLAIGSLAVVSAAVTVGLVVAIGSLEPEDVVLIDFIETTTRIRVPLIRRLIPDQ